MRWVNKIVAIRSKLAGDTVSPVVTERVPHGSSRSDDLVLLSEFQPLSKKAVRKMAVGSMKTYSGPSFIIHLVGLHRGVTSSV